MCRTFLKCRDHTNVFETWEDEIVKREKDDMFNEGLEFYMEEYAGEPDYILYMMKKLQYVYGIAEDAEEMEEMLGFADDDDLESEYDLLSDSEYDPSFFDTLDYDNLLPPQNDDETTKKTVYHNEPRTWELTLMCTQYPKIK
jgi:hypothetical protein